MTFTFPDLKRSKTRRFFPLYASDTNCVLYWALINDAQCSSYKQTSNAADLPIYHLSTIPYVIRTNKLIHQDPYIYLALLQWLKMCALLGREHYHRFVV